MCEQKNRIEWIEWERQRAIASECPPDVCRAWHETFGFCCQSIAKTFLALTVLSGFLLCASAAWAQSHPHPSSSADGDLDRDCYYWLDARVPDAECWTRCPVGTEAVHVQSRARYHPHAGLELTRGRLHICRAKVERYAGRRCYAETEYEAYTPTSIGHGPSYRVLVEDVQCRKRTLHAVPRKSFENMRSPGQ